MVSRRTDSPCGGAEAAWACDWRCFCWAPCFWRCWCIGPIPPRNPPSSRKSARFRPGEPQHRDSLRFDLPGRAQCRQAGSGSQAKDPGIAPAHAHAVVIAFVALTLVPTIFLFVIASGLLNQVMAGWFHPRWRPHSAERWRWRASTSTGCGGRCSARARSGGRHSEQAADLRR